MNAADLKSRLAILNSKLTERDRRALWLLAVTCLPLLFIFQIWLPIRGDIQKLGRNTPIRQSKLLTLEKQAAFAQGQEGSSSAPCIANPQSQEIIIPSMSMKSFLQCLSEDAANANTITDFSATLLPEPGQVNVTIRVKQHG